MTSTTSTNFANQVQGAQVTGDQSADPFEALVREEIAKQLAARQETGQKSDGKDGQSSQPAGPININLGGQTYTFQNVEQLNAALNQMVDAYQQELAKLQEAGRVSGRVAGEQVTGDAPPPFDMKKYAELMAQNPIEAQDYLDSYRFFGGTVSKPSEYIRERLAAADRAEKVLAAYQFRNLHPELNFLPGEQAAAVINRMREEVGLPWTVEGLEAAYALAQKRGLLPTREQIQAYLAQQQAATPAQPSTSSPAPGFQDFSQMPAGQQLSLFNNQPAFNSSPAAPPTVGRSAAPQNPGIPLEDLDKLSTEQIAEILRRADAARQAR